MADEKKQKTDGLSPPYTEFFTANTTNGQKVAILLELLGLKYVLHPVNLSTKEQKQDWFLKINPNGKIPALVDVDDQNHVVSLAESGALLVYLSSKYDTEHKYSYPATSPLHWKEIEFLFFHASYLNPNQANYNVFKGSSQTEAFAKFQAETDRAYTLVEQQLKQNGTGYLVGNHISLADIIALPHAKGLFKSGFNVDKFPQIKKWIDNLDSIPQVQAAFNLF